MEINLSSELGTVVSLQVAPFWPQPWPAALLCSCHDLFLLTQLAQWPISFLKNYFIAAPNNYHMLSTAFMNLEMKKKCPFKLCRAVFVI